MRIIDDFGAYDRFALIDWLRVKADGIGPPVRLGHHHERIGMRQKTGQGFGGQAQMRDDLGNNCGIFDGDDDPQGAATISLKAFSSYLPSLLQRLQVAKHGGD